MSKCTRLSFLALSVLSLALSLTACSDDRNNNGGTIRRKDSGVTTFPDAGEVTTTDSGTTVETDSGTGMCNNTNCALHELQGAFPGCQCLSICENGYVFNTGTRQCDPVGTPDGGVITTPDSGTTTNPDAGTTQMNCTSAAQCTGTSPACVTVDQSTGVLINCAGQADCTCVNSCNFETPGTGCPSGERCGFAGSDSNVAGRGFCIPAVGGGVQNGTCDTSYDANGDVTGDTCEVGFACWGSYETDPRGRCAQLCNPSNGGSECTALGNYQCDDLGNPGGTIGVCLTPRPAVADIGETCSGDATCNSGLCATLLGVCSSDCSGVNACPSDTFCFGSPPQLAPSCLRDCSTGGNALCNSIDSNSTCHLIGTAGICLPRCVDDTTCLFQGQTCNTANGACEG